MKQIHIGEIIKQRRIELNLTQEELCEGICEPPTMSRIEKGRQTPSHSKLRALLGRLGLPSEKYYAMMSKNELEIERLKNEIILSNNQRIVINENKEDVSEYFIKGALISLKKALDNGITLAILKQKSPSCGYKKIYNGNFDGTIIEGNGIFTDILLKHNIKVLTEEDFKEE